VVGGWGVLLKLLNCIDNSVLDSEQSNKCIDTTMLCFFFAYAQTKISKNFDMYQKMCINITPVCNKKKIDLFQKNPAEKFSVP